MTVFTIIPLDVGDTQKMAGDQPAAPPSKNIAYYIESGQHRILVDTGPPYLEERSGQWYRWTPLSKNKQMENQKIENALKATAGVEPDDIDIVILTHLHFDHVGQVDKFTRSKIILSDREFSYALHPIPTPINFQLYLCPQAGITSPLLKGMRQIHTIKMEEKQILDGLTVIPTPGHTIGSISVCVNTAAGTYVITGNAVDRYATINGDPEHGVPYHMLDICMDQLAAWDSFALIDEKVGRDHSRVLPGHDALVFNREIYP